MSHKKELAHLRIMVDVVKVQIDKVEAAVPEPTKKKKRSPTKAPNVKLVLIKGGID